MTSIRMPALDRTLVGDADLAGGQVAQPAVHELADDQRDVPKARSWASTASTVRPRVDRVEGDAGAGDAQPDDEHVDLGRGPGRGRRVMRCGSWRDRPASRRVRELGVELVLADVVVDHRVGLTARSRGRPGAGPAPWPPGCPPGCSSSFWPSAIASGVMPRIRSCWLDRDGDRGRAGAARGRARRSGRTARSGAALRTVPAIPATSRSSGGPGLLAARRPVAVTTTSPHSRVIRSPSSWRHVGPGAVDRHPGDAGASGDLGQRRTSPADVEDAVASGVEVRVLRVPRLTVVTK